MATHPYGITQVQQVKKLEAPFSYYIFLHIDLDAVTAALKMGETSIAHEAKGNEAPRDTNVATIGLQFTCGGLGMRVNQVGSGVGPAKFARKWIKPKALNVLELFLPLLKLVAGLKLQTGNILSSIGGRV